MELGKAQNILIRYTIIGSVMSTASNHMMTLTSVTLDSIIKTNISNILRFIDQLIKI